MRLNAETMTYKDFNTYMIFDYNGNEIHYCSIADTDEGYAECTMYTIDKEGRRSPLHSYDPDSEYDNGTVHTYTLHTFVIKNIQTNEIVAKV